MKDEWGIRKLQEKLLEIIKNIHEICCENNIEYFLCDGSLLGAVRHKGFIPWDDDVDIFMRPHEYNKLRTLLQLNKELYTIQEFGSMHGMLTMAKIRLNNTTYIEDAYKNEKDFHQGIFIDIFILHNISDNVIEKQLQYMAGKYILLKMLSNRHYNRKKGVWNVMFAILKLLPQNFLIYPCLRILYSSDDRETKYVGNLIERFNLKKSSYPSRSFQGSMLMEFEGEEFHVPKQPEEILKIEYGDYLRLPSESEIAWNQHALIWDTEHDYTVYINQNMMKKGAIYHE